MATLKQKKLVEIIANGEAANKKEALLKAGYGERVAKNPGAIEKTRGFQELLKERLSDDALTKKHQEFLNSDNELIGIKALDMGYKLKGSYAPEKSLNLNINRNLKDNKKAQELADEYEEKLKKELNET